MKELRLIELGENDFLYTADAKSMYTNINTDSGLDIIPTFLKENAHKYEYPTEALIAALHIVFRNNLFRFGDKYTKQISGTAMGKRPAPPWATIFFAIHENHFVPMYQDFLLFYKRYLDDILGIWRGHPDPTINEQRWTEYKQTVNDFHGLEWEFTTPSRSGVAFMDMSLSIVNGRIESTLYEKKLNLYLYIPPSSAHPPGVLSGLIMGNVLRIFQLCTNDKDINNKLEAFQERLLNRGHQLHTLLPIFDKAIANAKQYLSTSEEAKATAKATKKEAAARRVYFHVPYHPNNPPAADIQRLWQLHVADPPGQKPLNQMTNLKEAEVPVDQLVIANHRAPNLGNLLSYRKIAQRNGPKVSSFLSKD